MNNRISIINYGLGTLRSVENAVKNLNFDCQIINNPNDIDNFDKIILPGVGSTSHYMKEMKLRKFDIFLDDCLKYSNVKLLGICVGMQILFEE